MKGSPRRFYLFCLLLLFSSCGREYDESVVSGIRVGQSTLTNARALFTNERNIALRICESYRAKWFEFRLSKINETFEYRYNEKLCNSDEQVINPLELKLIRASTDNDQPLLFQADEFVNYVQSMQTHEHGDLSLICDPLMKQGETPVNIYEREGELIKFSFIPGEDESDSYIVYTIDPDNDEIIAQKNFKILTRPNSNSQNDLKGLVLSSERAQRCTTETSTEPFAHFTQEYNL